MRAININLVSSLPTQLRWWWLSVDGSPRSDGPNYWPVTPRDLPLPGGWARGHGRSREWSPGTMSPKRAVGSISIWWLCSVDSFCSLFMHVQVCSASFGRFLQFAALLDHSEASQAAHAEAFADGGESGPALLGSNFAELRALGEISISADDCLVSRTIAGPSPPNTPTRPPNPIAIAPRPSTCR